jgi:hypothetical protein
MRFNTLLLLLILSSCSVVLEQIEKNYGAIDIPKQNIEEDIKANHCPQKASFTLYSENKKNQVVFQKFIKKASEKVNLSSTETALLWAIAQMSIRPDLSSPSARLSIAYHSPSTDLFIDSYSKSGQFSYFSGLETLAKRLQVKHSIKELLTIYKNYYPQEVYATNSMANFLNQNKDRILKNDLTKSFYIRGDETLKKNEGLRKLNLLRYYKMKKDKNIVIGRKLIPYKAKPRLDVECNYDLNIYDDNSFLIAKTPVQANVFGITINKRMYLFASTQELHSPYQTIPKSPAFLGKSLTRSPAICLLKKNKQSLWITSNYSRDPGQHIYHLLEYGMTPDLKTDDLVKLNEFSRHLFLTGPLRLIFESERGNQKQLDELLKLRVPVYNSDKLGDIGLYSEKSNSFIIDDRNYAQLSCFSKKKGATK